MMCLYFGFKLISYTNCTVKFRECDIIIFSDIDPCNTTGALQLSPVIANDTDTFGRLEICYDGYWGSVCDDYADSVTADVACKQLGHREGEMWSV